MPVHLILTLHILQSLALADNAAFWNCLVAMCSKASSGELPSAYNVSTHLHNQTQQWLAKLKVDILVSNNFFEEDL